jgi:hypothetical protein
MVSKKYCDICGKDTQGAELEIVLCRTTGEDVSDEHYDLCWDCNDALLLFVDERKRLLKKGEVKKGE